MNREVQRLTKLIWICLAGLYGCLKEGYRSWIRTIKIAL